LAFPEEPKALLTRFYVEIHAAEFSFYFFVFVLDERSCLEMSFKSKQQQSFVLFLNDLAKIA